MIPPNPPEPTAPSGPTTDDPRAPYRVWPMEMIRNANGSPRLGTQGRDFGTFVVMTADTFKRLVAENQNLATARFEVAQYD